MIFHLVGVSALLASFATALPAQSLQVQAGYHVIYSYPGLTPPSQLYTLISQGKVGGVILFGENVGNSTPSVVASLQSAYRNSSAYAGSPLLILTDQEGGEVRRLPGGPDASEKQIGSSSDPTGEAAQAGHDAYSALTSYNNNGNLAPVLDVYRHAGNFIDEYQRSYSNHASIVAGCGAAFVQAQQSAGALATAKHFPGLGAAQRGQDTDEMPVTLNVSLSKLRSVDEAPYPAAIKAGVDMIMASWALYPALDASYPAGLSKTWIQSELRGRLGYTGVTITDAIEAGALQAFGSDADRAILATRAGMDIILAAARNVTQGQLIVDALVGQLQTGALPSSTFATSSQRILAMRSKLSA